MRSRTLAFAVLLLAAARHAQAASTGPFAASVSPYERIYVKASNTDPEDRFGVAVAISGDTLVVGAPFEDSSSAGVGGSQGNDALTTSSGAAYVLVRSGAGWVQQAYLKASNAEQGDLFGYAVAVSGDTLVVSAIFEDGGAVGVNGDGTDNSASHSGAVYVFVRNGTSWSQQAYLKASNTQSSDGFGRSVAVDGDTVVVGAFGEDSAATTVNGDGSNNGANASGAAYVFVRSGTTWSQQAYLKASNAEGGALLGDLFGSSVAVSGDTIVVGAPNEASAATGVNGNQADNAAPLAGAAYVFVRSGTTWSQEAYLKASNAGTDDEFGWSVSVSEDTTVVGARGEASNATTVNGAQGDDGSPDAGAAYVFVRSGTAWSQQAYLKASNGGAGDELGWSVSVSGDLVVASAPGEDSTTTAVNGDGSDDATTDAGAGYVFARSGTSWSQASFLKAPNTGARDGFGVSVSISGPAIAAGAPAEDSGDLGIDGNQVNEAALDSGAAYLFLLDPFPGFCHADDGSSAACPCSNAGDTHSGCDNTLGTGGVRLDVLAQSTGPNRATLTGTGFPATSVASVVVRSSAIGPTGPVAFGDGVRCVGTAGLVRLGTAIVARGAVQHVVGHGGVAGPGGFYYQLWYRDTPSTFCDPFAAFNLSSGRAVAW